MFCIHALLGNYLKCSFVRWKLFLYINNYYFKDVLQLYKLFYFIIAESHNLHIPHLLISEWVVIGKEDSSSHISKWDFLLHLRAFLFHLYWLPTSPAGTFYCPCRDFLLYLQGLSPAPAVTSYCIYKSTETVMQWDIDTLDILNFHKNGI